MAHEIVAAFLGFGGPTDQLQLIDGLHHPRLVNSRPTIDEVDFGVLQAVNCREIQKIHANPLPGDAQLFQSQHGLVDEIFGGHRWPHRKHVSIEPEAAKMLLTRQLALANQRFSLGGNEREALNAGGAQPKHHDRIGGVTDIQKIREHQRAEILMLHRRLQSRQAILGETLHIDAEWGKIRVEHLSSCRG